MPTIDSCQLTTKDYTILEVMQERRPALGDALSAILQRKISSAVVMFREDIPGKRRDAQQPRGLSGKRRPCRNPHRRP